MKAGRPIARVGLVSRPVKREDREPMPEHEEGGQRGDNVPGDVVMVLFPLATWELVQDMAKRSNTSTAEVLSAALWLADDKLKAAEAKVR